VYKDAVPDLGDGGTSEETPIETARRVFTSFVKLYALADKLQDLQSANLVIDAIIRYSDESQCAPTDMIVPLVYDLTPPGSRLRGLVVNYYLYAEA